MDPRVLDRALEAFERVRAATGNTRLALAHAFAEAGHPPEQRPVDFMPRLLEACAEALGVPVRLLVSPTRNKHLDRARRVAVWALREAGLTWVEVGQLLGHCDHSTAIRLHRKANERADEREAGVFVLGRLRGVREAA